MKQEFFSSFFGGGYETYFIFWDKNIDCKCMKESKTARKVFDSTKDDDKWAV